MFGKPESPLVRLTTHSEPKRIAYLSFLIFHLDQRQRVCLALMVPAYFWSRGLLLIVVFFAPSATAGTIHGAGMPSVYEQIVNLGTRSAMRLEEVQNLLLGVSALPGCSIPTEALIVRIQVWGHIYPGTCWRIAV